MIIKQYFFSQNQDKNDSDVEEMVTKINKKKKSKLKFLDLVENKSKSLKNDSTNDFDKNGKTKNKITSALKADKNTDKENIAFEIRSTKNIESSDSEMQIENDDESKGKTFCLINNLCLINVKIEKLNFRRSRRR